MYDSGTTFTWICSSPHKTESIPDTANGDKNLTQQRSMRSMEKPTIIILLKENNNKIIPNEILL